MARDSELDIQAAKKRCDAATEEKWFVGFHGSQPYVYSTDGSMKFQGLTSQDAEFTAHARTDLPAALEALEEAQGLPTEGETCDSCGSAVAVIWHARDEEWEAVVGGPGGLRCPRCFAAEAEQKGIHLAFVTVPFEGNWTTDLHEAQGKLKAVRRAVDAASDSGQHSLALVEIAGVLDYDRILSKEGE